MPRQQAKKYAKSPINRRVYLAVPRERKDDAKDDWAEWDPDARSWYYTQELVSMQPHLARRLYDTFFDQAHHDKIWRHYNLEPTPIAPPRIPTQVEVAKDVNGFITGMFKPAPAVQATVNGFLAANAPAAPASQPDADDDDAPQHQRELERLLQAIAQSQMGNTVLTTLHGKAACYVDKDNQNHILMASEEASKDDGMIAVAIVQAKNLFGNAIEITGDEDFQRRALGVILKYDIEVVLTNPKQQKLYEEIKQEFAQKQQAEGEKEAVNDTAEPPAPNPQAAPDQEQPEGQQTQAQTDQAALANIERRAKQRQARPHEEAPLKRAEAGWQDWNAAKADLRDWASIQDAPIRAQAAARMVESMAQSSAYRDGLESGGTHVLKDLAAAAGLSSIPNATPEQKQTPHISQEDLAAAKSLLITRKNLLEGTNFRERLERLANNDDLLLDHHIKLENKYNLTPWWEDSAANVVGYVYSNDGKFKLPRRAQPGEEPVFYQVEVTDAEHDSHPVMRIGEAQRFHEWRFKGEEGKKQADELALRLCVIDAYATPDPDKQAQKFAHLAAQQSAWKTAPATPAPQPEQRPQQNFPRMEM